MEIVNRLIIREKRKSQMKDLENIFNTYHKRKISRSRERDGHPVKIDTENTKVTETGE